MNVKAVCRTMVPVISVAAVAAVTVAVLSGFSEEAKGSSTELAAYPEIPTAEYMNVSAPQRGTVSLDKSGLSAQQLMDWMKSSGMNFVLESGHLPKDKTYSVHLNNVSPDSAIEAVATALGMAWTKKGDVYVLKPSSFDFTPFFHEGNQSLPFPNGQMLPMNPERFFKEEEMKNFQGFKFEMDEKSISKMKKLMEEDLANIKPFTSEEWKKIEKDLAELRLNQQSMQDEVRSGVFKDLKELKALEVPGVFIRGEQIEKLISSLSQVQKEKMKKNGYLTADDLNSDQRKLLGELPKEGTFEIRLSTEKGEIVLRGGK